MGVDARTATPIGDIMTTDNYCPMCRSLLQPGDKFCFGCGYALEAVPATTTLQPPDSPTPEIRPDASFRSSCGCGTAQPVSPQPIVLPTQELENELTQEAHKPKTKDRPWYMLVAFIVGLSLVLVKGYRVFQYINNRVSNKTQDADHNGETAANRADAIFTSGLKHLSAKNYKQAIEDFTSAINLNSSKTIYYIARGQTYRQMDVNGFLDLAIADFNKCLQIDPNGNNGEAFAQRGLAYLNKRRVGLAMGDFETAIAHNPSNASFHAYLAIGCAAQGKFALARTHCTNALALDPNNENAIKARNILLAATSSR